MSRGFLGLGLGLALGSVLWVPVRAGFEPRRVAPNIERREKGLWAKVWGPERERGFGERRVLMNKDMNGFFRFGEQRG